MEPTNETVASAALRQWISVGTVPEAYLRSALGDIGLSVSPSEPRLIGPGRLVATGRVPDQPTERSGHSEVRSSPT